MLIRLRLSFIDAQRSPGRRVANFDLYRAWRCDAGVVSRTGCLLRIMSITFNPNRRQDRLRQQPYRQVTGFPSPDRQKSPARCATWPISQGQ